jgi:hypothetical protein
LDPILAVAAPSFARHLPACPCKRMQGSDCGI